jgi:hypothetical protein
MSIKHIGVKPGTRNHRGYFVQHASGYHLVEIDQSGWAVICLNDAVCYHVDPENLQMSREKDFGSFHDL